ncbi:MAG TPA: hypothetical protein P5254_18285, partial [Aquihabitans sp.]|nr:hypothetical protein [Aquihabitans sp.]
MAFGQQSGPPATHRQLQDLLELVIAAGHVDLRDARGPLGLTQRQAAGRFTSDEADALIERLQAEADAPDDEVAPGPAPGATTIDEVPAVAPRPKSAPGGAVA